MNGRQRQCPGWQLGALNGLVLGVLAEILLRAIYYYEGVRAGPASNSEIILTERLIHLVGGIYPYFL